MKRHLESKDWPLTLDEILDEIQVFDIPAKLKHWLNETLPRNTSLEHKEGNKYIYSPHYMIKGDSLVQVARTYHEDAKGGILLTQLNECIPQADKVLESMNKESIVVPTQDNNRKDEVFFWNDSGDDSSPVEHARTQDPTEQPLNADHSDNEREVLLDQRDLEQRPLWEAEQLQAEALQDLEEDLQEFEDPRAVLSSGELSDEASSEDDADFFDEDLEVLLPAHRPLAQIDLITWVEEGADERGFDILLNPFPDFFEVWTVDQMRERQAQIQDNRLEDGTDHSDQDDSEDDDSDLDDSEEEDELARGIEFLFL